MSIATLGFLLQLTGIVRAADRAWGEAKEEQRKLAEQEREFVERQSRAEKKKLTEEKEKLQSQLEEALSDTGFPANGIVSEHAVSQLSSQISKKIDDLIAKMERVDNAELSDPAWHLELAKGHMARGRWRDAAEHFDAYVKDQPNDFQSQFSRGVAYANIRGGETANLQALRAYNEAIVFMDDSTEEWIRPRLFIYRGAMLKRLGRLDESEADLLIGKSMSTTDREKADADYNLACIYSLKNERRNLLETLKRLQGSNRELQAIRNHIHDYFTNFSKDPQFLQLIGKSS